VTTPRWPRYAAAGTGFLWFLWLGGWSTLDPTRLDWLLEGDWSQHLLGWLLFRNEPWTMPLGTLSGALYPVGSTIGYTDSNPIVALILKPFSPLLPQNFQFIGLWLASCFVMQGYVGARLASLCTRVPLQQWLAGSLFVLSPVLAARVGHDTLCAHWLILSLLYLGLRAYPDGRTLRHALGLSVGLQILASAIHPYLAVMLWPLVLAFCLTAVQRGQLTWRGATGWALGATAGMVAVFALLGYLGGATATAGGFGIYSADLLTLVNPMGLSRVLPAWPLPGARREGFGYLGLGGLLACALAIGVSVRDRRLPIRRAWPVAAACTLLSVYALSSIVTIAGHRLLTLTSVYRPVEGVVEAFRSSGRFVWPLHYLALTAGVWGCVSAAGARRRLATTLLAIALVAQATDLRGVGPLGVPAALRPLSAPGWPLVIGRYHHLAMVPMQVVNACPGQFPPEDAIRFMLQAYRLGLTFNSGVFARFDTAKVRAACQQVERHVVEGTLDPQTIYVVSLPYLDRFRRAGASCGILDGDWICVAAQSDALFRAHLRQRDPG